VKPCVQRLDTDVPECLNPTNQGEYLKKARLEAGIFLTDMAGRLGINRTTLTDYEFNRGTIPCKIILRIEEICEVERFSLFDEDHLEYYRFCENYAQIIRDYCKREKISLCAFAKRLGVGKESVCAWVRKKQNPGWKSWALIKELIGEK
jgi:transcriptional regulator with XRE-family HTH domain